jgi:hypothetical protein
MPTEASREALAHLRDPATLQWYVIPLVALTIYVYAVEIERRNWNLVFAGLAFWGMDWLNEIANGLILHFTDRAALWTAPGKSAYLILVGLNIEICFMFSIAGLTLAKFLPKDPKLKILGVPNRVLFALANSIFCVAVEVLLNRADLLIWEYSWWGFPQVGLIVVFGYLHFNLVAFWVHDMKCRKCQLATVGGIWGVAAAGLAIFGGGLGWI